VEPGRNQLMSEFGWGGSRASRLLRLYRERKQRSGVEAVRLMPGLEADRSEAVVQQSGSEAVRSGAVDRSGEQSGEQSGGPVRKADGVDRSVSSSGLGRSSEAVQSAGAVHWWPGLEADQFEAVVQLSGSEAVRSGAVDRSGEQSGEQSGGTVRKAEGVGRSVSSAGLGRSSEAVQSGGPVQQSGSEALRSASSSGPVVQPGGAVRSAGASRGEPTTKPAPEPATG